MNVDKYNVLVSFRPNMRADATPAPAACESETYAEAARGTLADLFPGDNVQRVRSSDLLGTEDFEFDVALSDRRAYFLGDCERVIRQLRKSADVFYIKVSALMFHDRPLRTRLGEPVAVGQVWVMLGQAKYYANEGTTNETILPVRFVNTLLAYSVDAQDMLYASGVLNELIRSNPDSFADIKDLCRLYRYGEPHEIKFGS